MSALRRVVGVASREAAQSSALHLLMKLTFTTFLFVTLHFALARSSVATTFALPPVMAVFPFIPVVAYTLIISAFSYISARILKHFNFSSDLLAFLRRKGRLAPLPITHSHELLPTSTASSSTTPLFGMYAASSNVTRSTSFDALPVLPPRLISPASSPPGPSQLRRVTETPLPSFSILKPTLYRHKQRRSRSLGLPAPRPQYWTSRFPPSPPVQQEIIDGRRINSEEDIPLAFLSGGAEYPSREPRTLTPAPLLHEPPMSAPILFMPESSLHPSTHGPLVDISPLSPESTSSSSRQTSPIAGPSYSSSESSLQSFSPSDSNSPSSLSRSTQSSDIGVQPIGGVGGFAYDWGFDRINLVKSPPITVAFHESSSIPPNDTIVDVVTLRGQIDDGLSGVDSLGGQDINVAEGVPYTATEGALVQVPVSVQWDLPHVDDGADGWINADPEQSTSVPSTAEGAALVTHSPPLASELVVLNDTQVDDPQAIVLKPLDDDGATHEGGMTLEKLGEDSSILPPLPLFTVENSDIQERPLIAIDTSDLNKSPKRSDSLSAGGGAHSSPMTPSQTPTPPASPPLMSIQASKSLAGIGRSQLRVAIGSPMSEPASPITMKEREVAAVEEPLALSVIDPQTSSAICQEDAQGLNSGSAPAVVLQETPRCDKTADLASPASSDASPTCSPGGTLPAWSERAADAQPLGMSAAQAALVQEEVAWPKTFNVEAGNEGGQKVRVDEETTPITTEQHAQLPAVPVEGQETLPGTFPMSESTITKQGGNLSASSTAVVTVSGASHRRRIMRGFPIDVALAMQMRPGLGIGADPAWMVRFLMAAFGWFAVMMAGRGGEVDVYAL